jgi:hypothetical protein
VGRIGVAVLLVGVAALLVGQLALAVGDELGALGAVGQALLPHLDGVLFVEAG